MAPARKTPPARISKAIAGINTRRRPNQSDRWPARNRLIATADRIDRKHDGHGQRREAITLGVQPHNGVGAVVKAMTAVNANATAQNPAPRLRLSRGGEAVVRVIGISWIGSERIDLLIQDRSKPCALNAKNYLRLSLPAINLGRGAAAARQRSSRSLKRAASRALPIASTLSSRPSRPACATSRRSWGCSCSTAPPIRSG